MGTKVDGNRGSYRLKTDFLLLLLGAALGGYTETNFDDGKQKGRQTRLSVCASDS